MADTSPDATIAGLSQVVVERYTRSGMTIATAESCTGGMIAAAITAIAGSSAVLDRGFVTYSNAAKQEMLGVSAETLCAHGAVSEQTAREMALGAIRLSNADVAVSVTGIAGPGGGSPLKPVGLVFMGVAVRGKTCAVAEFRWRDARMDRAAIRAATTLEALDALLRAVTA